MKDKSEPPFWMDMPNTHPCQAVADHEVLLNFNGDSKGIAFREWWRAKGQTLFAKWLQAKAIKDSER